MNSALLTTTSRIALAAATLLCASSMARAASFTVDASEPRPTATKTVEGDDIGIINAGATLETTGISIRWAAPTTGEGIRIVNDGAIISGGRAIDTSGAVTGRFTLTNNGSITSANDLFRINTALTNSVITIENSGSMSATSGQAIDFAAVTAASNTITITNRGTIQSETADAIRPGAFATVINSGLIQSTDLFSDGDGVDFQGAGGTVQNLAAGRIIGSKHGVTGDGAIAVTNEAGGLIAGTNGSGVNVDSTGATVVTIVNRGTIRGAATLNIDDDGAPDGVPDGDGDGVDVDGQVDLTNSALIQGTGATGTNDGVANTADGIAAGGGVIRNLQGGVIEAFDTVGGGTGRAILIDDSAQGAAPFATTLTNAGVIRSDGVAVTLIGAQSDTIDNAGLISSGATVGVDMGGGTDTFISRVGSRLVGAVSGGAGADTLALAGTGGAFALGDLSETGAYRAFETLSVQSGASYTATGSSAFTGAVEVAGSLALNGSLASASATVMGVLSGTGTIGALAVQPSGAVAPGAEGSVGTLTVANGLSFAAGSTYRVDVIGSVADRIVAGSAAIAGGSVVVTPVNVRIGDAYEIVSAGTVAGAFGSVAAPSLLFADPTLAYSADAVTLAFARNGVAFASLADTPNQQSVAAALDGAGAGSELANTLGGTTDLGAYRESLDLLSGEGHASLGTSLFAQNALVADAVLSRLRQAAPARGDSRTASLGTGGPALAYADNGLVLTAFNDLKAPYAPAAGPVIATWAQAFGQWSRADGRNGSAKVDGSLGGVMAGADVTNEGLTFGLAGGYVSADSDVDARRTDIDADTVLVAAYAGAVFDAFRLSGGASYGWSDIDSRRTVVVGGLTERPKGSYDGSTANAFAEAAYGFDLGSGLIEPFAQLAWSRIETDSFSERNAPVAGLRVRGLDFDTVYTTLGARFSTVIASGMGEITPYAALAWRHAMDDITPRIAAAFRNGGGDFTAAGAPIGKDSLLVQTGLDVAIAANTTLGVAYEGQFASDARTNTVKGRFAYNF